MLGRIKRKILFSFLLWGTVWVCVWGMLGNVVMGQNGSDSLNHFRYGDGILVYNSDGESVKGAEIQLMDSNSNAILKGEYDEGRVVYYFKSVPKMEDMAICLLKVSHRDYECVTTEIHCHEAQFSRIIYLGRKGESFYRYAGSRIPYAVVSGAVAVRLNPTVKSDENLVIRWNSLKQSLGLVEAPELADSLQISVVGWNRNFSWQCEFFKFSDGRFFDGKNSEVLSALKKDPNLVLFAGPILSKGLSVDNSFVFIPNPSKVNLALEMMAKMGIKVEYGVGNQGFGFLKTDLGTGIFDIMNELEASGNFDELSPGVSPLYMEDE
jgi:hypothetical protein